MKKYNRLTSYILTVALMATTLLSGCSKEAAGDTAASSDTIVLRVSNWEEYIDEGDELEGTPSIIDDFEKAYYEETGKKVKVEYSTFGTNEDLYHRISIGDRFDLVCPSEYMIMKLMDEDMVLAYPSSFYDKENEENAYVNNISPYIEKRLEALTINDKKLSDYAAGYMWGTLGFVYNPEEVAEEDVDDWDFMVNKKYNRRITTKDSVRDCYFAAMGMLTSDLVSSPAFKEDPDYETKLSDALNDTSKATVDKVEKVLTDVKENAYAFETDSGKADLVTGKVLSNLQWSGDAVYSMEQAEEEGVTLYYSVPESSTNLWFDGWVMLKDGILENTGVTPPSKGDRKTDRIAEESVVAKAKIDAATAFVNFLSRPENAVRNMDYIGYTSVISGEVGGDIEEYVRECYEVSDEETTDEEADAEEDSEDSEELTPYDISYFFGEPEGTVEIMSDEDSAKGMLFAQYPTEDVIKRSVVMAFFPPEDNARVSRMWINVRCADFF